MKKKNPLSRALTVNIYLWSVVSAEVYHNTHKLNAHAKLQTILSPNLEL